MSALLTGNITLNETTNRYEAIEAGIKYEIEADFINDIVEYMGDNTKLSMARWYHSLDADGLKKVQITKII